jgi:NTE family protein
LPAYAERPRIGLALAGGGAKGSAHIAVLELLEANNIPVDFIAGTSIGAYVGGLYALGYSAAEIRKFMIEADFGRAYSDGIDRQSLSYRHKQHEDKFNIPLEFGYREGTIRFPKGLLYGQTVSSIYRGSVGNIPNFNSFDDLAIPFRAIATDLATSSIVVLGSGDLVEAIQASATVPGALAPIVIEDRILVDGGLAENLPISQVRRMGANIVIAVDITAPLLSRGSLDSGISVFRQLSNFLTLQNIDTQKQLMNKDDIYIRPDLDDLSTTDFSTLSSAYEAGKIAAEKRLKELKLLSIDSEDYREYRRLKEEKLEALIRAGNMPIVDIILKNHSSINQEFLKKTLGITRGSRISTAQLNAAVNRVYALDKFERVTAEFVEHETGRVLVIEVTEKSWGPSYLEAGLSWEDDFTLNSIFSLDLAFTLGNITRNNGE